MKVCLLVVASLSTIVHSLAHAEQTRRPLESLAAIPNNWHETGKPARDEPLSLQFVIREAQPDDVHNVVFDVSDPDSASYGEHLTRDQAKALMLPREEHVGTLLDWLASCNIDKADIKLDVNWIRVQTIVAQAEELLSTSFSRYRHDWGHERTRATGYSLPEHLHQAVKMVHPVTHFGRPFQQPATWSTLPKRQVDSPDYKNCSIFNSPRCLRKLYNFPPLHSPATRNNSANILGVNSFLGDYFQYKSLANFLEQFAPWAVGSGNISYTSVSGGEELQGPDKSGTGEADLDVQYAVSLAWPYAVHVYSDGATSNDGIPDAYNPSPLNEDWIGYLQFILDLPDEQLPRTFSTSYADDEQNLTPEYTDTACKMFGQLAARGVSFIVGSGDTGVGTVCEENFGDNSTAFIPSWPSVCPYVTSVGGTMQNTPEVAWPGSGGGFSNRFARPAWQDRAVAGFLRELGDRFDGLYNRTGRGYPDLAAQAVAFLQRDADDGGEPNASDGTSASTPVVASVFALINGARMNAGTHPLGFLNPWIYRKGRKGLTDITGGKQSGCQFGPEEHQVPNAGFSAVKGWDAATGFGTANVTKLLDIALRGR